MMGLQSWMCWLGWFAYSMVISIVTVSIMTAIFTSGFSEKYPGIIVKGNPLILWIFLILYLATMLCFIFLVSTFVKKPTQGTSIGLFIWLIISFIGDKFVTDDPTSNGFLRYLFSFVPNILLRLGFNAIIEFEKKDGIGFDTIWTMPNKYFPHPPMGCVFMTFILDCVIFSILTWYIENVYPGEYGVGRPWYFPFTKAYWMHNKISDDDPYVEPLNKKPGFEEVSAEMRRNEGGIKLRNLYKQFYDKNVVNGLGFDIYQNEITVLLGHNGAGKTTTMNMITGLTSPTRGSIIVNGYDIYENMDVIRKSLGLCPQFNVQFTDLTLLEHLIFFAMLKGAPANEASLKSQELLRKLNLSSKENVLAGELSGGMRRKLSLAMAVVGDCKTLILDEPTSGLDPEARREIWDFLLEMRGERTILITTHYMEEADILGDRIAIMHNGVLQCYGSTMFLKKHYGTGYVLSVLVGSECTEWEIDQIISTVQGYVPLSSQKNCTGNSITIALPTNDTGALSDLFVNLEKKKESLRINNFGVSITTMEEVFLKVGEIADELDRGPNKGEEDAALLPDSYSETSAENNIQAPLLLIKQQLVGLLGKRFRYTKRKWLTFLLQIFIPLGLLILAFTIMKVQGGSDKHDTDVDVQLNLQLEKYKKSKVFCSYSNEEPTKKLSNIYSDLVKEQHATVENVSNVSEAIVEVGLDNMDDYERALVVAAEFNYTTDILNLNAMYGSLAMHGVPISINLITNALLKHVTQDSNMYSINITNNPIPYHTDILSKNMVGSLERALNWMFLIPLAFTVMIGLLIIFPQEERLTGVMHMQIMSGVSKLVYWISNFIVDFSMFIVMAFITILCLLSFDNGGSFGNTTSVGMFKFALKILNLLLLKENE